MATYYVTSVDIASGVRFSTDSSGADYIITRNAVLASTDNHALNLRGSYHDVTVQGMISATGTAVILGDGPSSTRSMDSDNILHVADGGVVRGSAGVWMWSAGLVANKGEIMGSVSGVTIMGNEHSGASVVNDGLISSGSFGIISNLQGSSYATIVNRGVIAGQDYGLYAYGTAGNIQRVTNYGLISGDYNAYESSALIDLFTNRGEIRGGVGLGEGNDLYDGRGGRIVDGVVLGQDGDDRFMAGEGEETFNGGAGIDTLDFRSSEGLRVSLIDDSGSGAALGDTYIAIERVIGSRCGADTLIGDGAANTLEGRGGADKLKGGGGADRIMGGAEKDRLCGGAGDDSFVFEAPDHGGDVISDFGRVTGNDDRIEIDAAGFGLTLSPGALAASRFALRATDNKAQDAGDRFVFRDSDDTLWFDADGTGAGAAVLIADLQAGAVLTAADIVLV